MKLAKSDGMQDKVTIDMTPMIDCCFQLIIFFMLTLRVFTPEGDFNIKMPLAAPSQGTPEDQQLPPIKVRLRATPSGELQGIEMGNRALGTKYAALRGQIRDLVGDSAGPGAASGAEVEFDSDYDLKYKYVIEAITSVSGYVKDGTIHKLVDKIKFSPPRKPQ